MSLVERQRLPDNPPSLYSSAALFLKSAYSADYPLEAEAPNCNNSSRGIYEDAVAGVIADIVTQWYNQLVDYAAQGMRLKK